MTFIARRTDEYLQWQGKEYPISNVKIEHAFHPVPADISPSTQTYLRVSLDIDLSRGEAQGYPSPFTGAYPHRGDYVTLVLQQVDDEIQNLTAVNNKPRANHTIKRMDMLVDSIEFGETSTSLSLTQRVDGFSNKINADPVYHWRNQFYGWLVGQKEKFFEDGQALRYTNPAPAYKIGIALAAAGYTYAPPATPLTVLSLPIFGSFWTNQWDNPCYVQDYRTWNDIVGPEGQIGNLDNGADLGFTVGGYSRNGVGASGEVVQSRSNRDRLQPPHLWYSDGGSWMTEGIIKVAQTRRIGPFGIPQEHRRSDIFASWMIRWEPSREHMDNLYQVKIITEDGAGASVRWDDSGKVELYFNQYEDPFPESKETRATVMWTGQFPTNISTKITSAVLEQDGNSVRFYASFGGAVVDSGFVQMPRNLHAVGGLERHLPAWAELWIFNDVKNGRKFPRSGICGLQVSTIPDNQPQRKKFLDVVRTTYQQWDPKVNFTPANRLINQTTMPSLRDRTAGEVLKDLCESLAVGWWIDADGVAQVCPLESLVSGTRGNAGTLNPSYDIGSFGISTDLTLTCSRIEVEFADWAISQTRKTQIDVWKKGGTIAVGDTIEDFIQPDESTEWLDLDTSVEDQGARDWSWIADNNGSFYGGCTLVSTQVKSGAQASNGLTQWEWRYAATIDCKVEALSPWVTKLTQRAISGTFINSDGPLVKETTSKDIHLRTATHDYRGVTRVSNTAAHGIVVPDIELPVIRARGTMKRIKQKHTISGGTPNARTLTLEGWDFIDDRKFAKEVADVLSRYALDAQPHFTSLEIPYDLSIVLGSVVTIRGMNEFGRENLFGAIVTGVICGLEHTPQANKTSLTVWVFSYDKTLQTWDVVEANNESGKRTWQQLEDTRQRQGTTWTRAESNPQL